MCLAPSPPPPEKPPRPQRDPALTAAKGEEAQKRYRKSGYTSTVLTAPTTKKTTTG